jgi:glycosyltransferase involved in cell wall biosynthesis
MKLLLLSDAAAPHTRRWANWFAANGHEVHVVTFNEKADSGYENVVIHYLWHGDIPDWYIAKLLRSVLILWRLFRLVRSIRPDVTHSHSLGSYAFSAAFLDIRPRVLTPWGLDLLIDVNVSKINKFLVKFSLSTANVVTTDAVHFLEKLSAFGVKDKKVYLIPFGTDVDRFRPPTKKLEERDITIISTRTLNPVHCVDDLIMAIPEIARRYPEVRFIIVGGGEDYQRLSKLVQNSIHSSRVRFTGMLNEGELIEILQISDIYISTSPLDAGLAASTAEAMSCGLPVIHPDVADNRSWVNESGGLLYRSRDIQSLIDNLDSLLAQRDKLKTMGDFNRATIKVRNNLNVNMMKMKEIYLDLINSKN